MSRHLVRAVPFVLIALLLAGCGNKGDLVKPAPPAQPAPAPPAQDAGQH